MNYPSGQQFPPGQPPQGPQRPSWTSNKNLVVLLGGGVALLVVVLLVVVIALASKGDDPQTTSAGATTTSGKARGKVTSTPTADVAPDEFRPTAPGTYDPQGPKQWRPKGVKPTDSSVKGLVFRFRSADSAIRCEASTSQLVCQAKARNAEEAQKRSEFSQTLRDCPGTSASTTTYDAFVFRKGASDACRAAYAGSWPDDKDLQVMPASEQGSSFAWLPSPFGDAYCTMAQNMATKEFTVECATTDPVIARGYTSSTSLG
ncbi:hypothetical protein [Tsukamurella pulmonis]|uniref:hypothetical protein n=1 Tax=Tsukamurella pulmonis TaxID=47312 RepID=UPI000E08D05F|nr:hypothetical protein [Tsukamurella pulmonis]RDH12968.1 hypothetical protein DVB88_04810 [Tsukamurella pulmonis]